MQKENYKIMVDMINSMKENIDTLKKNMTTRLENDYHLKDDIVDASLPYMEEDIPNMEESELKEIFEKYSIGDHYKDATKDEMIDTFKIVKNMSLLLLSSQKEFNDIKNQSTEIMDEYLNFMSSEKVKIAREERLSKMKDLLEKEENEFEKKKIQKMINLTESSKTFDFVHDRFNKYGDKEVDNIIDAYLNERKGELIIKKYSNKIKQFGYNPEIYRHFFNIEETFLPEEYWDYNNLFLFFYMRMVAYSDPYNDADKIYVRALTGAIAELFYHKMSPDDEKKFIDVVKSVDDHFDKKKNVLAENNTTSPNHPVRQEAKKSIEERRLIALKKKLKDLKYPVPISKDITVDELQEIFDEYVEELIDKQIEHEKKETDENKDIVKDMKEASESIKADVEKFNNSEE